LLRVVEALVVNPNAKIPTVELPAADPLLDAALADVADEFKQPEYVYLSRVVTRQQTAPNAKMPTVELPAADPPLDAALAAVANELTHVEKVYLLRVFKYDVPLNPNAKIPTVPL
jgi:hypothetical protein